MADPSRYRLTRASFDLISVFGSLGALAVPGPVFRIVLGPRGYSASAVRNQLVRMVDRGLLSREQSGRVTLYRRSELLDASYAVIAGDSPTPDWTGSFAALLVTIPESRRSDRDRVIHVARFLGYRQLRGGVLIGFTDASTALREQLRDLSAESAAGVEPCRLTPPDRSQARAWVQRAFELPGVSAELTNLGRRVSAARSGADLTESSYFDLLYDLSRLAIRLPATPVALLADPSRPPNARIRSLLDDMGRLWGDRLATAVLARVGADPSASLVQYDPRQWQRIGRPMPLPAPPD